MPNILDTIVERKRVEVAALRSRPVSPVASTGPHRPFLESITPRRELGIIAEVKKASPSRGVIRADFDPVAIARSYEAGGAHAVSVLTDQHFFQGSLDYLVAVRSAIRLPVLRKDFIIAQAQVIETAQAGADAMLLIAAILDDQQLADLHQAALSLGIEPLVEVHSERELERVMNLPPRLVGINNRDLTTFVTDINVTLNLTKRVPPDIAVVAESGIRNRGQASLLRQAGVRALLVGESLMRLDNPGPRIRELSNCEDIP